MWTLKEFLEETSDQVIADRITRRHDEARMKYQLFINTVSSFEQYRDELGRYYAYHYSTCVSPGAILCPYESAGAALMIIEEYYRRQDGNLTTGYNDARDGTYGLRMQLDIIAEHFKAKSLDYYLIAIFSKYTPPVWEAKVAFAASLLDYLSGLFPSTQRLGPPERYASDIEQLARRVLQARRQIAAGLRRQ